MQTPKMVTLAEYQVERAKFLNERCHTWPGMGVVCCGACGGRIKAAAVKLEIHEPGSDCTKNSGEEFETGIPYCPACEELPASRGCVHG